MRIYAVYEMLMSRKILFCMALLPLFAASCLSEDNWRGSPLVPEGYESVSFTTDIPAMQEVVTRAVDYDGGGVQNMTLFCFDSYGLFISTVSASLSPQGDMSGTFTALVPKNTRTVHFVANQNMTGFVEDNFRSKSEAEVMALLEGSSGRMIYWARFACDENGGSLSEQIRQSDSRISMIRNHALVSVRKSDGVDFEISGMAVCNTSAFGTVAPFHPDLGFDFSWPGDRDFVTLPLNDAKMSDINDVTTELSQYVFESENRADDPVSVIVKGHGPGSSDLYYRVLLIDDSGNQYLIRRNHHYILNIEGALSYGQPTFSEALSAPATNNVWISISEDVNEVRNSEYVLSVSRTSYVLDESYSGKTFTVEYSLSSTDGSPVYESDKPEVSWVENNVAAYTFNDSFLIQGDTGHGSIDIDLDNLSGSSEMLHGTLLVKKGKLQRTVKIILIRNQRFVPSWVSTQVYNGGSSDDLGSSNVTLMFTIPETCPSDLFPLNVYLSVDELDVRGESGMRLPVVTSGAEGYYGVDNGIGYKYVYVAEAPGVQRVYFRNKLYQDEGHEGEIMLEAQCFETLTKTFTYSANQYAITVSGLSVYDNSGSGAPLPGYAADEVIYYRLVPRKRYADVKFDMVMTDLSTGRNFGVGGDDEFLLYSSNLDGVSDSECTFVVAENAGIPSSDGRVLAFKPNSPGGSEYSVHMLTNCPNSAEVVRISSNQTDYLSMFGSGQYSGNMYRSVVFELANYRPFRFAAQVNGTGTTEPEGQDGGETVDHLSWTYGPGHAVDISIDITSFAGTDGKSVDPFGEEFEIYIDAPMLSLDESRLEACNLTEDKLRADPSVPGRFVYTVDPDRAAERKFGTSDALQDDPGVDRTGERKTLPFVTATPVSAGDIVISSNQEKVVFDAKTFTVTNESIIGTLLYEVSPGSGIPVPEDSFVPFELVRNNSRIGSVSVGAGGSYELRLRKEYQFNWYSDAVQLMYEKDGVSYTASFQSLSSLAASPDIVLKP